MSAQTGISWTDSTFNPWMGCTKVSPACDHCYAERDTRRFGRVQWGAGQSRVRTTAAWKDPARWNRLPFAECSHCGARDIPTADRFCGNCHSDHIRMARRRVFCASWADWLDNEVPIEWLVDLLDLIRRTPNLDWLLLTKRVGNWHTRITEAHQQVVRSGARADLGWWLQEWLGGNPPPNVWIGATVIDQAEADRDVPKLLRVPAAIRFLSIEPMLGPIELDHYHDWLGRSPGGKFCPDCPERGVGIDPDEHRGCLGEITDEEPYEGLDWIIAGGESGPHARPMHPDWVRSLRDQCSAAGVAFHFKQWGEWLPGEVSYDGERHVWEADAEHVADQPDGRFDVRQVDGVDFGRVGKKTAGRLLDGREHNEFPA